jgi:hypothetical protein
VQISVDPEYASIARAVDSDLFPLVAAGRGDSANA